MSHWISRLARRLADLHHVPATSWVDDERDADARRLHSELDAIRVHFRDHA